jgi:hypothetical protein
LFTKQSGYATEAENRGDEFNFYTNPVWENVSPTNKEIVSVSCVSYHDAEAFCAFNKLRLPTPEQWVSFVTYVDRQKLFSTWNTERGLPRLHFTSVEWVRSPRNLIGRPPMQRVRGVSHESIEPEGLIQSRPQSAFSVTFRVVSQK